MLILLLLAYVKADFQIPVETTIFFHDSPSASGVKLEMTSMSHCIFKDAHLQLSKKAKGFFQCDQSSGLWNYFPDHKQLIMINHDDFDCIPKEIIFNGKTYLLLNIRSLRVAEYRSKKSKRCLTVIFEENYDVNVVLMTRRKKQKNGELSIETIKVLEVNEVQFPIHFCSTKQHKFKDEL